MYYRAVPLDRLQILKASREQLHRLEKQVALLGAKVGYLDADDPVRLASARRLLVALRSCASYAERLPKAPRLRAALPVQTVLAVRAGSPAVPRRLVLLLAVRHQRVPASIRARPRNRRRAWFRMDRANVSASRAHEAVRLADGRFRGQPPCEQADDQRPSLPQEEEPAARAPTLTARSRRTGLERPLRARRV